jgi:adenylate kinase
MGQKIIFIGGIHGVGKTTSCQELASKFHISHFSAGDLITLVKKDLHRQKEVENVKENQENLLLALNKYLEPGYWYLLDGHFCLLNKNKQVVKVPFPTFELIQPKGILTLIDKTEKIHERLVRRDNNEYDLNLLSHLQEEEIRYAKCVADALGVPYRIDNFEKSKDMMYSFVENLINEH